MSRIALTGASGFVGQHVLHELQARGIPTLVLGRRPVTVGIGEWRRMDLHDPDRSTIDAIGACTAMIHLAWGGLPNYDQRHHLETELPAHQAFLAGSISSGLPALVVSGTCLEYGMQEGELHESQPALPSVPYAQAKDRLRIFLERQRELRSFRMSWARLFYVYGCGQSPRSLWPLLQAAIDRGDSVFPMSAGQQVRDFLPIGEVARSLVDMAVRALDCGVVNLSSGKPMTVERQVRAWISDRGASIEPELGRYPYPAYEPFRFWGSTSKREAILSRPSPFDRPTKEPETP
jgi:nucleoside-diphosphate-sugar epimerase